MSFLPTWVRAIMTGISIWNLAHARWFQMLVLCVFLVWVFGVGLRDLITRDVNLEEDQS